MKKFDVAKFKTYVSKITSKRRLNRIMCWIQKRIDKHGKILELKEAKEFLKQRIDQIRNMRNISSNQAYGGVYEHRHSHLSGVNLS